MRKALCAALAAPIALFTAVTAGSQEQEAPQLTITPVEIYTCNYLDGKDAGDLDAVVEAWNKWADQKGMNQYFALTLSPHYYGPNYSFDIGWLGSWPDGATMGNDMDVWVKEGREMSAKFGEVVDCDTHSNFAGLQLKSPGEGPPPDTVVLAFSDCSVTEGVEFDDLLAALNEWSAYQEEKGYGNGAWMLFPVYGGGGVEFDFKLVDGYDSHSELGADYDRYGTGGDYVKYGELLGDKIQCDDARVYDGVVRRRQQQQD